MDDGHCGKLFGKQSSSQVDLYFSVFFSPSRYHVDQCINILNVINILQFANSSALFETSSFFTLRLGKACQATSPYNRLEAATEP